MPSLEELSLTDLDPDHLSRLLRTLSLPHLATLALDLPEQDFTGGPDQDFTGVVEIMAGVSSPAPPLPISALHTLRITALECAPAALAALLRALVSLRVLELDFARVRDPNAICGVLLETVALPFNTDSTEETCECEENRSAPVLPRLEEARLFGLRGERVRALMAFRARFAEGCECECSEYPPSSASSCSSPSSSGCAPAESASQPASGSLVSDVGLRPGSAAMPRFTVRWNARRRGRDAVLDQLVKEGRVGWADEDEGEDDDVNEEDFSEDGGGEGAVTDEGEVG